jgi:hypothetical protein
MLEAISTCVLVIALMKRDLPAMPTSASSAL